MEKENNADNEKLLSKVYSWVKTNLPSTNRLCFEINEHIESEAAIPESPVHITENLDLLIGIIRGYQIAIISAIDNTSCEKTKASLTGSIKEVDQYLIEYYAIKDARPNAYLTFTSGQLKSIVDRSKTLRRQEILNPENFGCPTGDCPHDNQNQCVEAMIKFAQSECPVGKVFQRIGVKDSQIILEIQALSASRLQDITVDTMLASGFKFKQGQDVKQQYQKEIVSRHGQAVWDRNPWCWDIYFKYIGGM